MRVQYLEVSPSEEALGSGVVLDALLEVVRKSLRALMTSLESHPGFSSARLLRGSTQHVHLLEVTWAAEVPGTLEGWPLQFNGIKCRAWVFDVLETATPG